MLAFEATKRELKLLKEKLREHEVSSTPSPYDETDFAWGKALSDTPAKGDGGVLGSLLSRIDGSYLKTGDTDRAGKDEDSEWEEFLAGIDLNHVKDLRLLRNRRVF